MSPVAAPPQPIQMLLGTDGVQSNISDFIRPNTALKIGDNVNMITRGILTNRYSGWVRQRSNSFNSGAPFLDFGIFTAGTGVRTLLFQCGSVLYSYDGATETAMQTGLSTTNPPCLRMFAPVATGTAMLIYMNGVDEPKKFTVVTAASGSALQLNGGNYPQTLGAPLPARSYDHPAFVEPFLNRVVIAGFNNQPFDVMITNAGTCETVTGTGAGPVATDGGIFTVNPDLGAVTAVKAFKLSNATNDQVVLIGQTNGVSIITGTDALSFRMFTLTAEYGIPSNRAFVQVMNDLWFLASDGIRRFSNLSQNANLLNSSMTYLINDIMSQLDSTYGRWACVSHHRSVQEVVLWFPLAGSTTNNQGIVLNYNNDASSDPGNGFTPMPIAFTKSGTAVACLTEFKGVMYGGGYAGLLQQHYTGNLYDTTPVNWEIRCAFIKPQNYENSCYLERCTILTEGAGQDFLCSAYVYTQHQNTLVREQAKPYNKEIAQGVPVGGLTILGSWVLGAGAFGDSGPKRHKYEPQGHGAYWELQLRGNQANHTIDWLGTECRIKEGGPNA